MTLFADTDGISSASLTAIGTVVLSAAGALVGLAKWALDRVVVSNEKVAAANQAAVEKVAAANQMAVEKLTAELKTQMEAERASRAEADARQKVMSEKMVEAIVRSNITQERLDRTVTDLGRDTQQVKDELKLLGTEVRILKEGRE